MADLIAELQAALAELDAGTLEVERMDALTERSRELYERLVVLRYKAFEQFAKGDTEDDFRIGGEVDEAQTDLLSAIEEIETEQKPPINPTPELFSFEPPAPAPAPEQEPEPEPAVASAPEPEVEDVPEPEPESEPIVAFIPETEPELEVEGAPEPEPEPTPAVDAQGHAPQEDSPIHEQLATDEESLVERLERAPLAQIKGSISLNQKFLLINELFDGDSGWYDQVIGQLDQAGDRAAAFALVDGLGEDGAESRALITELIERRYA
ncbi:MAG: hypothetical protein ACPF83_03970 [Flavobacteriales bacterium]